MLVDVASVEVDEVDVRDDEAFDEVDALLVVVGKVEDGSVGVLLTVEIVVELTVVKVG